MNTHAAILVTILIALLLFPFHYGAGGLKTGKEIFESKCSQCHGKDGTKGKWGAKDLSQSTLTDSAIINIIIRGKRLMPSWKNELTEAEIIAVKDYIKTLR